MDWKRIYLLPRLVTLHSYFCSFQYKDLNKVLYLNKKLFKFRISTSPLCPFCRLSDETVLHLFYECNIILNLWNELDLFFENEFTLFDLTPQAAFLGFLNVNSKLLLIQNYLLLIFKIYIYNSRRSELLKIKSLIWEITKVKNIEQKISLKNEKNMLYTRENGNKLKMFWRPKLFGRVKTGGETGKRGWFSVTWGMGKWVVEDIFSRLFVNYSL